MINTKQETSVKKQITNRIHTQSIFQIRMNLKNIN